MSLKIQLWAHGNINNFTRPKLVELDLDDEFNKQHLYKMTKPSRVYTNSEYQALTEYQEKLIKIRDETKLKINDLELELEQLKKYVKNSDVETEEVSRILFAWNIK